MEFSRLLKPCSCPRLQILAAGLAAGSLAGLPPVTGLPSVYGQDSSAAVFVDADAAFDDGGMETPRQQVTRLLVELHSDDSSTAQAAEQTLKQLGIRGEQLQFARRLKHPDPEMRLQLVRQLPDVPPPLRSTLLDELMRDADPQVQAAAVQSAKSLPAKAAGLDGNRTAFYERELSVGQAEPAALVRVAAAAATDRIRPSGNTLESSSDERPRFSAGQTSADDAAGRPDALTPEILNRPVEPQLVPTTPPELTEVSELLIPEPDAPRGFTGPSGILSPDVQEDSHFVPVPDRWRLGYPRTDRYGLSYPWTVDYIGVPGHWWDPYNQNVLKGDYPIIGQHTFMNLTATSQTLFDLRRVPTPTTPFESTRSPNQREFFGRATQQAVLQNFFLRFDLFHGSQAAFKPLDWQIRLAPAFNLNDLQVRELSIVNPSTRAGRTRFRNHSILLQEYFIEAKLADLSPDYDFLSARAGNQLFNSDFRGFIFFDTNRSIRLFGTRTSNRHQFNLIWYDMVEKDTNSGLNTYDDRNQNVLIANYYIQDFVFPGYTFQTSFHWNNDQPSTKFDRNNFLVRPDPAGVFQPHRVEAYYFGIAGDGHMGRINVSNAFYWVTGRDGLNPIGGRQLDINAFMGALELSYDRDWARFRISMFYASGDDDPNDRTGGGFDTIMDNPVFAGGEFSYWQRQAIQLFGVRLVNDRSLVPNLRSSKIQGQSNFTNPGLLLFNVGFDADITPKLRMITNANYLLFDETAVLETFTFQGGIDKRIGLDLSMGFEWRPFHNDNMIALFGVSTLIPDQGFKDLYREFNSGDVDSLYAGFCELIMTF